MLYIYLLCAIFLLVFGLGIFSLFFGWKKTKVSQKQRQKLYKNFTKIRGNISQKEKIIDYDKLYHNILKTKGCQGGFGSILKQEPKQISDIQKIWKLHKVRNKLVHDLDDMSVSVLRKYVKEYEGEVEKLLKRL